MTDPRLLLVGPLPRGRKEGVSIGFENLASCLPGNHIVVNTNWFSDVTSPGHFGLGRAYESLVAVMRVLLAVPRVQVVYLTVSTSSLGLVRDVMVITVARLFGRRVVGHLKGGGMRHFYITGGRIKRRVLRATYNQLTKIIVLGDNLKNQFRFVRDHVEKVVVVPNGLPADVENGGALTKTLTSPVRILYLSNITPSKGLTDLIEALDILRHCLEVELHVCGAYLGDVDSGGRRSGEQFELEVHQMIDRLDLGDHVVFHGTVSGADKIRALEQSHVFVLPTYYVWEGQPISIIEAQAYGLPVVATEFRAIPETVNFGSSAEACKPRDPPSIARAITRITADSGTYSAYSREARKNYEKCFTNSVHIRNMTRVLCVQE